MARKWNPAHHPRDSRGRFTKSSTRVMKTSDTRKVRAVLGGLKPRPSGTAADAAGYLEQLRAGAPVPDAVAEYLAGGWKTLNPAMRSSRPEPDAVAKATAIDAAMTALPDDVQLTRDIPLKMFAHIPMDELEGMKVRDAAWASTSLKTTDQAQPAAGMVRLHIVAAAGTRAYVNAPDSEVLLARDTEVAISRVEPDGRGGWNVYGVAIPTTNAGGGRAGGEPATGEPAGDAAPAAGEPAEASTAGTTTPDPAEADEQAGAGPDVTGAPKDVIRAAVGPTRYAQLRSATAMSGADMATALTPDEKQAVRTALDGDPLDHDRIATAIGMPRYKAIADSAVLPSTRGADRPAAIRAALAAQLTDDEKTRLQAGLAAPADGARDLSDAPAGSLAASIAAGIKTRHPLTGGGSGATVDLVELVDGRQAVRKKAAPVSRFLTGREASPKEQQDAEELGAAVAAAFGLRVPEVVRTSDDTAYFEFMPGRPGAELLAQADTISEQTQQWASTDDGLRMGLADLVMGNPDRNTGNYLINSDTITPIDHALAFDYGTGNPGDPWTDEPGRDRFLQPYVTRTDAGPQWVDNPLTPADAAEARTRLAALRPQFEAAGRQEWHDAATARLDAIAARAAGTRNLIAAADTTTPAVDEPAPGSRLAELPPVDRAALAAVIEDQGPGIFQSPMTGGSFADVGRYVAEGTDARALTDRHGFGTVWAAAQEWATAHPDALARTPAEVQARRDERTAAATGHATAAAAATRGGDYAAARASLDAGELVDPRHVQNGRGWDTMRAIVARVEAKNQAAQPAGDATSAAGTGAPDATSPLGEDLDTTPPPADAGIGDRVDDVDAALATPTVNRAERSTDPGETLTWDARLSAPQVVQRTRVGDQDVAVVQYRTLTKPTRDADPVLGVTDQFYAVPADARFTPMVLSYSTTGGAAAGDTAVAAPAGAHLASGKTAASALAGARTRVEKDTLRARYAPTAAANIGVHDKADFDRLNPNTPIAAGDLVVLRVAGKYRTGVATRVTARKVDAVVATPTGQDSWYGTGELGVGVRKLNPAGEPGDAAPAAPVLDAAEERAAVAGRVFAQQQLDDVTAGDTRFRMRRARIGNRELDLHDETGARLGTLSEQPAGWLTMPASGRAGRTGLTFPDAVASLRAGETSPDATEPVPAAGTSAPAGGFQVRTYRVRYDSPQAPAVRYDEQTTTVPDLAGLRRELDAQGVRGADQRQGDGRSGRTEFQGYVTEWGPAADNAAARRDRRAQIQASMAANAPQVPTGPAEPDARAAALAAKEQETAPEVDPARIGVDDQVRVAGQWATVSHLVDNRIRVRFADDRFALVDPADVRAHRPRATQLDIDGGETTFTGDDRSTIGVTARANVGRDTGAAVQQLGMFDVADQRQLEGQTALLDALLQMPTAEPPADVPVLPAAAPEPDRVHVPEDLTGWTDEQLSGLFAEVSAQADYDEVATLRITDEWDRREREMNAALAMVPDDLTGLSDDDAAALFATVTSHHGTMDTDVVARLEADLDRRDREHVAALADLDAKRALVATPVTEHADQDALLAALNAAADLGDEPASLRILDEIDRRDQAQRVQEAEAAAEAAARQAADTAVRVRADAAAAAAVNARELDAPAEARLIVLEDLIAAADDAEDAANAGADPAEPGMADVPQSDLFATVITKLGSPEAGAAQREIARRKAAEARTLQTLDNRRARRRLLNRDVAELTEDELAGLPALLDTLPGDDGAAFREGKLAQLRAEVVRRQQVLDDKAARRAAGPDRGYRRADPVSEYNDIEYHFTSRFGADAGRWQEAKELALGLQRQPDPRSGGRPRPVPLKEWKKAVQADERPWPDIAQSALAWYRHLTEIDAPEQAGDGRAADYSTHGGWPPQQDVPEPLEPIAAADVAKADMVLYDMRSTAYQHRNSQGDESTVRRYVLAMARAYRIPHNRNASLAELDETGVAKAAGTAHARDPRSPQRAAATVIAEFRRLAAEDGVDPADTERFGPPDRKSTARRAARGQITSDQQARIQAHLARGLTWEQAYAEAIGIDESELRRQQADGLIQQAFSSTSKDLAAAYRQAYTDHVMAAYQAAEDGTRGHLLNDAGKQLQAAGKLSAVDLFSGPSTRAYKYASEELKRWWGEHPPPRLTFAEWKATMQGDPSAMAAAIQKAKGNEFT